VVLIGHIEDQFMDLPPEILQTSMRTHQKYFALRDAKTKQMANRFAVVSNMISADGGKQIVAGNERVLRARLSDAKFLGPGSQGPPRSARRGAEGHRIPCQGGARCRIASIALLSSRWS